MSSQDERRLAERVFEGEAAQDWKATSTEVALARALLRTLDRLEAAEREGSNVAGEEETELRRMISDLPVSELWKTTLGASLTLALAEARLSAPPSRAGNK